MSPDPPHGVDAAVRSPFATVFVALTLADAEQWPALAAGAARLGATAVVLQGEGPSLVDRLDALAQAGCARVLLVAVTFGATDLHPTWVGRVARWWLGQHPEAVIELRLTPATVGGVPTAVPDVGAARRLRRNGETLTSAAWADPPPVHTHVLLCRGPRCLAQGAEAAGAALTDEFHRRGMFDRDVLVTVTGCLYPCNRAPVVALQPQMSWRTLSADGVAALVDEIESRGRE